MNPQTWNAGISGGKHAFRSHLGARVLRIARAEGAPDRELAPPRGDRQRQYSVDADQRQQTADNRKPDHSRVANIRDASESSRTCSSVLMFSTATVRSTERSSRCTAAAIDRGIRGGSDNQILGECRVLPQGHVDLGFGGACEIAGARIVDDAVNLVGRLVARAEPDFLADRRHPLEIVLGEHSVDDRYPRSQRAIGGPEIAPFNSRKLQELENTCVTDRIGSWCTRSSSLRCKSRNQGNHRDLGPPTFFGLLSSCFVFVLSFVILLCRRRAATSATDRRCRSVRCSRNSAATDGRGSCGSGTAFGPGTGGR